MAIVNVAPALVRREGRMLARLVGVDAHRAQKRGEGNLDPGGQGRLPALAKVKDLEVRVGEVIGQQAEPRDDRRPAPRPGSERQDLDLESVARLGSVDVDRSPEVVDRIEVPLDLLDRRVLPYLALARHRKVEVDDVSRLDDEHRLVAVVPVVMRPACIDVVLGAHRSTHATARTGHPLSPGIRGGRAAKRTRCPLILSRFTSPSMMYTSFRRRIWCAGHGGGFGVGFSAQPYSYMAA